MNRLVELSGEACAGLGEGRAFTTLGWFVRECEARLGFTPYPGTFNLRVSSPHWPAIRAELLDSPALAIPARPGYCAAFCFRALLAGSVETALVIPDVAGYPADKIELLAATPIRDRLGVADGTRLSLHVQF
jgi:CTP-dependent riboflavin kinase